MKVAIVTDTYTPYISGVVNTVEQIEKQFNQMGVDFRIFAPGEEANNDEKHTYFKAVKFIFYNKMDFSFITSRTFRLAIEDYNPDICHIVTEGPLGIVAALYCKKNNVPIIASYTTDLFNYFKYYAFDSLKPALAMYLKIIHKNAELNLSPSQRSVEQLESIDICKNAIWKRGIDTELFKPIDKTIGERKELLYVGRIAKEKNIEVLLNMAKILNWQNYPFRLSLVGDGPILEELKTQDIPNVEFCGILRGKDLAFKYASSDAFVFASEHETFGNVILEAMACGLPVISTTEGGIIENLKDGYNGIAIKENTPNEFACEVKKLFEEPERHRMISKNAREYTLDKSWKRLTEQLLGYYRQVYEGREL